MNDKCPVCGKQYGKRKRCYGCSPGPKRTGEERSCTVCGKSFHVPQWVIADVARNAGTYCSLACKHQGMRATQPLPKWAKIDEPTYHKAGYVQVWAPEHPRANHGRVFEHILVAEQKVGRPITTEDHVHHKDLNPRNNDPDNLLVLSNSEHQRLHAAMMRERKRSP